MLVLQRGYQRRKRGKAQKYNSERITEQYKIGIYEFTQRIKNYIKKVITNEFDL